MGTIVALPGPPESALAVLLEDVPGVDFRGQTGRVSLCYRPPPDATHGSTRRAHTRAKPTDTAQASQARNERGGGGGGSDGRAWELIAPACASSDPYLMRSLILGRVKQVP